MATYSVLPNELGGIVDNCKYSLCPKHKAQLLFTKKQNIKSWDTNAYSLKNLIRKIFHISYISPKKKYLF